MPMPRMRTSVCSASGPLAIEHARVAPAGQVGEVLDLKAVERLIAGHLGASDRSASRKTIVWSSNRSGMSPPWHLRNAVP